MMPVPPSDTHDRGQRESREVPIDNHPMNRWRRAGAGLINSADVDWRGYPVATPDDEVPASLLTCTPFQMQEKPLLTRPVTPPPPPRPTSPPPAPCKRPKRTPLGCIDNKVYSGEIECLEGKICTLENDKVRLEERLEKQKQKIVIKIVIDGFCHLDLDD